MKKKYEDRVGEKHNRLTILEYLQEEVKYRYRCDCGTVGVTKCSYILYGSTKSCGCLNDEKRKKKEIDITGRVFGKLTAIARSNRVNGNGTRYWLCHCECGQDREILKRNLISGLSKSCGKCSSVGLQGKRFGNYTVIGERAETYKKGMAWLCKCDCGNERYVTRFNLVKGYSKSCGCTRNRKKTLVEGTLLESIDPNKKIPCDNTSGCIGVSEVKGRGVWEAKITLRGKTYHLGTFKNKNDAILARKNAEIELYRPILEKYESEYKQQGS